jgi:hypothetical protein
MFVSPTQLLTRRCIKKETAGKREEGKEKKRKEKKKHDHVRSSS